MQGDVNIQDSEIALTENVRRVDVSLCPNTPLSCNDLERYAILTDECEGNQNLRFTLSTAAVERIQTSHARFQYLRAAGTPVYGTTTGFGPHVAYPSGASGGTEHGAGLIAHLSAGYGADAPREIVRAAMLLRLQTLIQGYSGVRLPVVERYIALLNSGITPAVPIIGSVGASGDLIPLAHIARVLSGEGEVWYCGARVSTQVALEDAHLTAIPMEGRDVLSLTNGTSFLTAYAVLAAARATRLLATLETLTGMLYVLLGCRTQALDARLHAARGHMGQQQSAAAIRTAMGKYIAEEKQDRPLQEIYSIRCAPQIIGACRENLDYSRRLVEVEMNGINDNPLIVESDSGEIEGADCLHGGNFQGQQVAFAADALNSALTQLGVLAERQIDALVTPSRTNDYAPLLLAWEPGRTSGLAGAQITATALVAEMRAHLNHHATFSIPTNGGNQDVVSMGTLAARMVYDQTERLAAILAVLSLALLQLNYLRQQGKATGRSFAGTDWNDWVDGQAGSESRHFSGLFSEYIPLREDRPLHRDIAVFAKRFLGGTL